MPGPLLEEMGEEQPALGIVRDDKIGAGPDQAGSFLHAEPKPSDFAGGHAHGERLDVSGFHGRWVGRNIRRAAQRMPIAA